MIQFRDAVAQDSAPSSSDSPVSERGVIEGDFAALETKDQIELVHRMFSPDCTGLVTQSGIRMWKCTVCGNTIEDQN